MKFENGDEERELNVVLFRTRGFHLGHDFESLFFGFFVILKVFFGGRCHPSRGLSDGMAVKHPVS